MVSRIAQLCTLSLCCAALLVNTGCSETHGSVASSSTRHCGTDYKCGRCKPCKTKVKTVRHETPCQVADCDKPRGECDKPAGELSAELPPNARPGECWAKVFVAPQFKTVTERVLVKEATERLEIIPAEYEWVEERVCVKEASKRLVEVPAEYATRTVTIQTGPAHTDWVVNKDCLPPKSAQPVKDVFCLVSYPEQKQTLSVECQIKPPTVREEIIPAEYQTVRRQKLVRPATTRKVCIPAEYTTVTKTVKVCDGRMAWQRVSCEVINGETVRINANGTADLQVPAATIRHESSTTITRDSDLNNDRDMNDRNMNDRDFDNNRDDFDNTNRDDFDNNP